MFDLETLATVRDLLRVAGDPPAFVLLNGLDLADCVVSADALHTQPTWCRTILDQHGDYLVIAKRNQSDLRQAINLLRTAGGIGDRLYVCPAHGERSREGRDDACG